MKGTALKICPEANVVDLTHGVAPFDIKNGAREFEAISYFPVGFHVCVVDPGVGTDRKPIIIETARGDYLIGPDNGVLIPAANVLGGIMRVFEINNTKYMQHPVAPTFHGRDIFVPAAAHLANGVKVTDFGDEMMKDELIEPPYLDAEVKKGKVHGEVLHVNPHNHNVYSNIRPKTLMDKMGIQFEDELDVTIGKNKLKVRFLETFGMAKKKEAMLFWDDYNHIAICINQGFFAKKYKIKIGDKFLVDKV